MHLCASTTTGSRPRIWPSAVRSISSAPRWRIGELLVQRTPGEIKVSVYNPDPDQHGWQSACTVVEVITDDMPFLVDSVTMELARAGYGLDLVIHPVIRVRRDGDGRVLEVIGAGRSGARTRGGVDPPRRDQTRAGRGLCSSACTGTSSACSARSNAAVSDWAAMRAKALELVDELREPPSDPPRTA